MGRISNASSDQHNVAAGIVVESNIFQVLATARSDGLRAGSVDDLETESSITVLDVGGVTVDVAAQCR